MHRTLNTRLLLGAAALAAGTFTLAPTHPTSADEHLKPADSPAELHEHDGDHDHDHDHGEPSMTNAPSETAAASDPLNGFDSQAKQLSYALGLNVASGMRQQMPQLADLVDAETMLEGLLAGLGREGASPRLTNEEAARAVIGYLEQESERSSEAFLNERAARDGVQTLESGLLIEITEPGDDARATIKDQVRVHYTGTLPNGETFDSSYERGEPAVFPLAGVVPGFAEGLQQIGPGGKATLVIPPDLGYGPRGQGPIPPNSPLVFDVELIEILTPQTGGAVDSLGD